MRIKNERRLTKNKNGWEKFQVEYLDRRAQIGLTIFDIRPTKLFVWGLCAPKNSWPLHYIEEYPLDFLEENN